VVWTVAIPAIVISHLIGFVFLIYGLNRLTGFLTKAWRKLTCVQPAPVNTPGEGDVEFGPVDVTDTDTDSIIGVKHLVLSNAGNFGIGEDVAPKARASRWVRHCECSVSSLRLCPPYMSVIQPRAQR
jgi:hypothetical protein